MSTYKTTALIQYINFTVEAESEEDALRKTIDEVDKLLCKTEDYSVADYSVELVEEDKL